MPTPTLFAPIRRALRGLLPAAALFAAGAPAAAQQIPNSGFETWVTRNGGQAPQGYVTSDDLIARALGSSFSFGTVTRSTTARSGLYAAQAAALSLGTTTVPGGLILGDISRLPNTTNQAALGTFRGGIAYTARPAQLQFWYRFAGATNDSVSVFLELRRGPRQPNANVAAGSVYLKAPANVTSTYTLATLPLSYAPGTNAPDSLRFFVLVGSQRSSGTASLLLDDVSLSGGNLAARADAAAASVLVYPNPSQGGQFVLRTPEASLAFAPLRVRDALGREVLRLPARPATGPVTEREIDLRGRPAGVYVLQLDSPEGAVVRKLVVE